MIIKKVTKQGPCKGVIASIAKINKILQDPNIKKPIYMLGKLVHNDNIIKAYESKGIIILDGGTRIELVQKVKSGTVIITAHGVGDNIYQYLESHNIDYVDATCVDVKKTKNLIKSKLQDGYTVLYLGTKKHPEAEGMISLDSNIIFVDNNLDEYHFDLDSSKPAILTCQTTLSYKDVQKKFDFLKKQYPFLELASEVCNATKVRQEALIAEANDFDLCLVVGDKASNNTKSLKECCLKYTNTDCVLVENIEDLNNIDLSNVKSIVITSGASTPKCIVDEIVDKLQTLSQPFKCEIKLDQYITI